MTWCKIRCNINDISSFSRNVFQVDFDKTKHLSDKAIRKRHTEHERLEQLEREREERVRKEREEEERRQEDERWGMGCHSVWYGHLETESVQTFCPLTVA